MGALTSKAPARHERVRGAGIRAAPSWSVATISGGDPAFAARPSFGLLAPADPVTLAHAGQETRLDRGDFAILDLMLPVRLGATESARFLDFGDRALDRQIAGIAHRIGRRLPSDDPLGATTGTLLDQLSLLQAFGHAGLGDGVVATIVALVTTQISRSLPEGKTLHSAAMLQRAQGIIATRLGDASLRVTAVADRLGISSRHLSTLFATTGQSPGEYIAAQRIRRAQGLLGDASQARRQIADIATACGFDDQSHFSRCFKTYVGMTPRKYRESQLSERAAGDSRTIDL